jgi:hypothetical protein
MYICPVCFFDQLTEEPKDYNICDCCGTEFGSDDSDTSHYELRSAWIASGARWFFGLPPLGWSPWFQLQRLGRAGGQVHYETIILAGGNEGYLRYPRQADLSYDPTRRPSQDEDIVLELAA